jgi:phosphoglycerol transferase
MALLKLISFWSSTFGVTLNVYYLLGFPLVALTALWVLRQLEISDGLSVMGALLYAFLPYHFIHGEQHLFLANYCLIAPTVLVILWIMGGEDLLVASASQAGGRRTFKIRVTRKGAIAIAIGALLGCSGLYYALFGMFLATMGALLRMVRKRSLRPLLAVVALDGVVCLALVLNFLPHFIYVFENGPNPSAFPRFAFSSELFAVKIAQLLLPVCQHRFGPFAQLAAAYASTAPMVFDENRGASLGVLGSLGFLLLLAWQLGAQWRTPLAGRMRDLGSLNLCALLLATLGGFGSLFSYAVSPMLRAYARMSIFIAFFALVALLLVLEHARRSWAKSPGRRRLFNLGLGALLCFGLWDQTSPSFVPLYQENAGSWQNDEQFVQKIEAAVPAGSMVFQLPYTPFPEGTPTGDYQLFRGYLHSASLRWSYGAMKGRAADIWARQASTGGSALDFVKSLRSAGFKGLYLDRKFYPEAEACDRAMRELADPAPIVSEDNRLAFYRL